MQITLFIIIATLCVSFAPIFIKLSGHFGVPEGAMSAIRMLGTAALLLPFAWRDREQVKELSKARRWELLGAGIMIGLHFLFFIAAFRFTSFESVVILLAAQPLLAAVIGWLMLGERISRGSWGALSLAILGLTVFVYQDLESKHHIFGDVLVILAGLFVVLNYIWGRKLRRTMSFALYFCLTFGIGGFLVLFYSLIAENALETIQPEAYLWLGLLILIPTLAGHGLFNYLVKHVPVFIINLVILAETVISLLIKHLINRPDIFGTLDLDVWKLMGGGVLVIGVAAGLYLRHRDKAVTNVGKAPQLPPPLPASRDNLH